MEAVSYFELIGMVFSMIGAYLSSSTSKKDEKMILAYASFLVSNVAMYFMGILEGMLPLLIQIVFFMFSAINGITVLTRNIILSKTLYILMALIFVLSIYIIGLRDIEFKFHISVIESFAAIIAIIGSFLLAYKDYRRNAFLMFFVADILYAYIAYERGLNFFLIQSVFFWFTSLRGYFKYRG